jgi:hypothetical protein
MEGSLLVMDDDNVEFEAAVAPLELCRPTDNAATPPPTVA